jgi:SAM-dependent methyltransferase
LNFAGNLGCLCCGIGTVESGKRRPTEGGSILTKSEREWQDEHGAKLQIDAFSRPGTRLVFHRQFALVADVLRLESDQRVLDLGCGAGLFLAWLERRRELRLYGLDLSIASVRIARDRTSDAALVAGDAQQLPYADDSFDRVVCNGAIHHLPDVHAALRELYRVVVPGGRIVLYEPTATRFANWVRALAFRQDQYESPADLEHKHELDPERLPPLLAEVGFKVSSVSRHDWLAYPLSGMYVNLPIGRAPALMRVLLRAEARLERIRTVKRAAAVLAWRILVAADKPMIELAA